MAVRRGTRRYRKGSKSKTMKGRKDFTTKKSSKYFDRRGHRSRHAKGSRKRRRPYSRRRNVLGGMDNAARVRALDDQVLELEVALGAAENTEEDPAIIEGIRRRLHSAMAQSVIAHRLFTPADLTHHTLGPLIRKEIAEGRVSSEDVSDPTLGPMILKEALAIPLPPSPSP